jgi:hypothetical protein
VKEEEKVEVVAKEEEVVANEEILDDGKKGKNVI